MIESDFQKVVFRIQTAANPSLKHLGKTPVELRCEFIGQDKEKEAVGKWWHRYEH